MATQFTVILEDFEEELQAIKILVQASADPALGRPRTRVAGANAAVLLLAATFEEFVRQMARAFARAVVEACEVYDQLPPKLAAVAWKRTLEGMARIRLDPQAKNFSREGLFSDALTRFTVVYEFCKGDLTQDIYNDLIHNENNMRPQEINSLFKLSGLSNVCLLASAFPYIMEFVSETEPGKANGRLVEHLEDFFERRNQVAHSINAMRSSGPEQINGDIELLTAFGRALAETLEGKTPPNGADQ
jgi:hypothetical protein